MRQLGVVIVEQTDRIAWRVAGELEAIGHRVLAIARGAPSAEEIAGRLHPDLILIGQHTPPLDGIEAARKILARHIIPLVLLIDYPTPDLPRQAQETGILSYLLWPTDRKGLESSINTALVRYRELQVVCAETGDLQQALHIQSVIDRAKKVLARRLGLGEADAFWYLRRQSWSTMTSLGDMAAGLLTAEQLLFGKANLVGCIDLIQNALAPAATVPLGVT